MTNPIRRARPLLGAAVVGGLLLASCGGGDDTVDTAVDTTGIPGDEVSTDTTGVEEAEGEPSTTSEPADTTTTVAPTTTTTRSPFVVDQLELTVDGAETSQLATASNELPVVVFDRFEIDSSDPINRIRWQGIYCQLTEEAPEPVPTSTGFLLTVYADAAGEPDQETKVASYGFDISEIEQTRLNTIVQPCGAVISTWVFYDYSAPLADPLVLEDGETYWLAIQALTTNFSTSWGWRGSTSGDSSSLQLFNGAMTELSEDRAFALER